MKIKSLIETTVGVGAVALVVLFLLGLIWQCGSTRGSTISKVMWWNVYAGQMGNCVVEIDESQRVGSTPCRIAYIKAVTNDLSGITGHDYNMDGVWDRVFFNGYPSATNGCNSYVRVKDGWRWEPCHADKDMTPIPESEIPRAITLLDSAMTNRTIENLTTLWTYHSTTDLHRSRE